MPQTTDVAIIGGGVIGCSIAYQLAKRGIRSTVFEKDRLASSASGATGGIIGPIWYVDHTIEPYFDLAMRSLDMFPWLAQDLKDSGVDPEYRPYGVTKVALTDDLHELLKNNLIWQEELGIGVQWIDRDELFEHDPHMTPEAQGAVFSSQEANIRGQAYVNSLAHAACKLGATCIEGAEVTGLEFDGDRVIGVRTLTDVYHAEHTVLAAGAWTGLVNRWLPETIPVRPIKGQRITIRMRGFSPMGPVQSVIPQNDGTMFVGASREEGAFDHRITTSAVDGLLDNATLVYPVLKDAEFVGARAGIRPGSPDGMPILGPVPGYEGFSVASGHDHVGIILSPATGVDMAEYIATDDASRLGFFSIERFTDGRPQFEPKTLFSNIRYDR